MKFINKTLVVAILSVLLPLTVGVKVFNIARIVLGVGSLRGSSLLSYFVEIDKLIYSKKLSIKAVVLITSIYKR